MKTVTLEPNYDSMIAWFEQAILDNTRMDSKESTKALFDGYKISVRESYKKYLNWKNSNKK